MLDLLTTAPPGLTLWPCLALGWTLLFGIGDPGQQAPSLPLEPAVGRGVFLGWNELRRDVSVEETSEGGDRCIHKGLDELIKGHSVGHGAPGSGELLESCAGNKGSRVGNSKLQL